MDYQLVVKNWNDFAKAIERIQGEVKAQIVEGPASESEVTELEDELGFKLPPSLKEVLLTFSKKVEFRWFLPSDYELKDELSEIFCGEIHWSLEWIKQFNEDKNGWVSEVFPNKEDSYDAVWHDKLAFQEVGNGDYLAIDLSKEGKEPVVYLSHDDGEGHGVELASNFKDYVLLSSRLGCVGAEDWQWLPFVKEGVVGINPDCDNAIKFREILGVKA